MKEFLLLGNPNCGKTTLFNELTGDNQRIGNWPGVTIEKKTGYFKSRQQEIKITDLPGVYSLVTDENSVSQDEWIASKAVIDIEADGIINVVDACHLERHLYLSSQLLELGRPLILVLNMMDIAEQRGIHINVEALSEALSCKVIPMQAHKGIGLESLQQTLAEPLKKSAVPSLQLPPALKQRLHALEQALITKNVKPALSRFYAYRILEGDYRLALSFEMTDEACDAGDTDIILADARYQAIHQLVSQVQSKQQDMSNFITAKIDSIVLNRFLALPLFLAVMYLMFLFAINIGGAFQDFFDISTDTVFVQGSAWLLQQMHAPDWLIALLANGVGKGINTTMTFIPVIAAMFFFLSLLEASGYMARAAFVVDKLMRLLGLPGKAFVPMIVGFGCNVPAIMASRTLESNRDRLLTIMMSPFMSCSARLAIYAVFVAAFFPSGGQNVVFSLYMIGILMAVFTGFILKKTKIKGEASPLILELPAYHKPSLKRLLRDTKMRLSYFIKRAGRMIIPICVVLGALNAISFSGHIQFGEASTESVLSYIGRWLTPLFSPMGIEQDNWPATVGLLTGMLAKEVVVGSLNTLYAQLPQAGAQAAAHFDLWAGLSEAFHSIAENFSHLKQAMLNPVLASAPTDAFSQSAYGAMAAKFQGKSGAYAYLLFILLYIPCVSTMAVIRQEAGRSLMWFSIIWSFVLAYALAVIFFQMAQFLQHPGMSIAWIVSMGLLLALVIGYARFGKQDQGEISAAGFA